MGERQEQRAAGEIASSGKRTESQAKSKGNKLGVKPPFAKGQLEKFRANLGSKPGPIGTNFDSSQREAN